MHCSQSVGIALIEESFFFRLHEIKVLLHVGIVTLACSPLCHHMSVELVAIRLVFDRSVPLLHSADFDYGRLCSRLRRRRRRRRRIVFIIFGRRLFRLLACLQQHIILDLGLQPQILFIFFPLSFLFSSTVLLHLSPKLFLIFLLLAGPGLCLMRISNKKSPSICFVWAARDF